MSKNPEEVEITDSYDFFERDDILLNRPKRAVKEEVQETREERSFYMIEKFLQKFIDLMLQNQKIVEGLIRSNDALREDIAVMIGKMERLYDKFDEFVTLVKEAAREDTEESVAKEVVRESIAPLKEVLEKMSRDIKESNDNIADLLVSIDKRLKRLSSMSGVSQLPQQNVEVGGLKDKVMEILNKKQ